MFGYKIIKTSRLESMKASLATSIDDVKNLTNENAVLQFEVKILNKVQENLTRKRVSGKFAAKVKMFEPFKIRVTPTQSKRVQKLLFAEGEFWRSGKMEVDYTNYPFLVLKNSGLEYRLEEKKFLSLEQREITYRQFVRIYSLKQGKA